VIAAVSVVFVNTLARLSKCIQALLSLPCHDQRDQWYLSESATFNASERV